MTFNKKLLAGLVALAAASSAQAVTVAANDGWTLGVSGSVNQFVTFTDDSVTDSDNVTVANGLLPAFLSFDMTAPTMNGLDVAAHISISPGTNNTSGSAFEQREVYFTVAGGFGQILAGKALGLYGSHNILTEQTLFGVGTTPVVGGSTSLGGIGAGYDYAAWRSQVKWTSNDMNGFKLAIAVAQASDADLRLLGGQPTGSLNGVSASEDLRYEADLSYAGAFDGGSYTAWLSGMTQDQDNLAEDKQAWTIGGTLAVSGFEFMAQYSDSEGASAPGAATVGFTDTNADNIVNVDEAFIIPGAASQELEWNQYVVQAGYRFAGTTLVSANYSKLEDDSASRDRNNEDLDRITVGVYHDVNANLKLVAEYTKFEADNSDILDQDIFSLGGFVFF